MSALAAILAGALALGAVLLAVTRPSVVHALMYLVAALVSLGAAFFALAASFAGALQILVYAGAVVAVFVFVVMTVDASEAALETERRQLAAAWKAPAAISALAVLAVLAAALTGDGAPAAAADPPTATDLGLLLFGPWAVATELASLLLLAALVGVRHLGRHRGIRGEDRN